MPFQDPADEAREDPRFTLNAFMRYLSANASGREEITLQQKHPSEYQADCYDAAADVLRRFVIEEDDAIFDEGIASIRAGSAEEKGPHNIRSNAEVVEAFRDRRPRLDFGGLAPSPARGRACSSAASSWSSAPKSTWKASSTARRARTP